MDGINNTLLKIKALAEGTSYKYEREVALKQLHKLMEKHGITEQDLDGEAVETHDFKYRNTREHKLLIQIIYKVYGSLDCAVYTYSRGGRKISNMFGIDCTTSQKIEIDFLFDFYKKLYKKEEQVFYRAFIQKHNIFGTPDKSTGKTISDEDLKEWQNIQQMMKGMENATPHKQIEGGKKNGN
jgi:hypothetical protein